MTFVKGQSGNPLGRPKAKPFRDALNMQIAQAGDDAKALRRIADALIEKAASGDVSAIKEFADRMDGKVPQAIVGDDEESPIQMVTRIELVAPDVNAKD